MNKVQIVVTADDREQKSGVLKFLSEMDVVHVEIRRLSLGDYIADNRVLFERKTLVDLAVSIIDGRLFKQAVKLANSKHKSVLILEGTGKDLNEIGIQREAVQGALITISLILGIPVLRSMSPRETALLILYAARQMKLIAKGTFQRQGYRPKGKRKRQLYILQGLPGVGRQRAEFLLDAFGSVEGVITASSEELQSVSGIGKSIAGKIRWIVSEQIGSYGICDEINI